MDAYGPADDSSQHRWPLERRGSDNVLQHCRDAWDTPLKELSDLMVAAFLNQRIAFPQMLA